MLCAAAFGRNTFRQWCSSIHTEHAWTTTMKGLQKRVYCWIFSQSYAIFCICLVHRMQVVNNGSISVPLRFLFPVSLARKVKVFLLPWDQQGKVLHDHWIVNDPRKYGTTTSKHNDRAGEIDLFATASQYYETAKIHIKTCLLKHTLVFVSYTGL